MAVVAYLRVSTEKQFLENQREEIIARGKEWVRASTDGTWRRSAEK